MKHTGFTILLLSAFCLFSCKKEEYTINVNGRVFDAITMAPIDSAYVSMDGDAAYTNAEGYYTLQVSNLAYDRITVSKGRTYFEGYFAEERSVPREKNITDYNFKLAPVKFLDLEFIMTDTVSSFIDISTEINKFFRPSITISRPSHTISHMPLIPVRGGTENAISLNVKRYIGTMPSATYTQEYNKYRILCSGTDTTHYTINY
jgi:hypothetical protein